MGFRVWGLGFGVKDLGCRVWGCFNLPAVEDLRVRHSRFLRTSRRDSSALVSIDQHWSALVSNLGAVVSVIFVHAEDLRVRHSRFLRTSGHDPSALVSIGLEWRDVPAGFRFLGFRVSGFGFRGKSFVAP